MNPRIDNLPARIEDLTRRELISSAFAAALLIACGDDAEEQGPAGAGFPRTVRHAAGETTIPTRPERVVALWDGDALDAVLALSITPSLVGISKVYGIETPPWIGDSLQGVETFGSPTQETDLERVVANRPDLIVTSWDRNDLYGRLSTIAPTVMIRKDDSDDWRTMQRIAGEATGREAEAEAAIKATDAAIEAQAERVKPYAGMRVAVAYEYSGVFNIHGDGVSFGRLLKALGLTVEAPGPELTGGLSFEQIRLANDADIILSPDFGDGSIENQEKQQLFRGLPAVQNRRYLPLSVEMARACFFESALSVRWAVEQLADAVIAAAEGRGRRLD